MVLLGHETESDKGGGGTAPTDASSGTTPRSPGVDFRRAPRDLPDPDALTRWHPRLPGSPHRLAASGKDAGGAGKRYGQGGNGGRVRRRGGNARRSLVRLSPLLFAFPLLGRLHTRNGRILPLFVQSRPLFIQCSPLLFAAPSLHWLQTRRGRLLPSPRGAPPSLPASLPSLIRGSPSLRSVPAKERGRTRPRRGKRK